MNCKGCMAICTTSKKPSDPKHCVGFIHKTHGNLLRNKTDEELAEIMVSGCPPNYPRGECREYEKNDGNLDCPKCWLDWLKQEASDD